MRTEVIVRFGLYIPLGQLQVFIQNESNHMRHMSGNVYVA